MGSLAPVHRRDSAHRRLDRWTDNFKTRDEASHPTRGCFRDRRSGRSTRAGQPPVYFRYAGEVRAKLPNGNERHEPGLPDGSADGRGRLQLRLLFDSAAAGGFAVCGGREVRAQCARFGFRFPCRSVAKREDFRSANCRSGRGRIASAVHSESGLSDLSFS